MKIMSSYANEFISKFERISTLTKHGPSIGTYHENIVRSFLSNYLTNRFSVKTGFVYNKVLDKSSQQIDILIIDENIPNAYYFKDNDFAIVDSEAVVCGIEIKSNLTKNGFIDCCKKAFNYRQIVENLSLFYCFSFDAHITKKNDTLSKWFNSIDIEDNFAYYPAQIFMLKKGILQLIVDPFTTKPGMYFSSQLDKKITIENYVISNFLASVMKSCQVKIGYNSNPFEQYAEDNFIYHTTYRYGNVEKNNESPFLFIRK